MVEFPFLYVEMLQNTGRDDEVDSWNNWENMTNYTEKIFKPYLSRIDKKLHTGKTTNSGLIKNHLYCIGKSEVRLGGEIFMYEG